MEQAGAALEKIVAGGLRRLPAGQGPVLAWPLACGHAVATRTQALDFAQGVLRVEVLEGMAGRVASLGPAVPGGNQPLRRRKRQANRVCASRNGRGSKRPRHVVTRS